MATKTVTSPIQPPCHIAHVIAGLGTGGMENGLIHLINELSGPDWHHWVICLHQRGDFADRLDSAHVTIIDLSNHLPAGPLAPYRALRRELKMLRPDIVHTRNLPACDLPIIARISGVRAVVHSEHGLEMPEISGRIRRYIWVRRAMRMFVDHYLTLGSSLRDWLIDEIWIDPAKIQIVYNGVDPDRFCPAEDGDRTALRRQLLPENWRNKRIIGSIGRLSPVKNYDVLIKAFSAVSETMTEADTGLVIVGDGAESERLASLVQRLGLEHCVALPGQSHRPEDWLRLFDIFALPSHLEGISNTVLEAMATALPVVATDVGGTPELVRDQIDGLLVSPDDPAPLAQALMQLVQAPDQAQQMGRAARERVLRAFSWAEMANRYRDIYYQVLQAKAR